MRKATSRISLAVAIVSLLVNPIAGAYAQGPVGPAGPHHPQHALPAQPAPDDPWHMMRRVGPMRGMMNADCPMMGGMMRGEDMPSFAEGRVAFLQAELAITAAQKQLWDAYAGALRANLQSMHDVRQAMKGRGSDMNPVERLDMHLTAMEARVKALQAIKPPLAALYDALTPDQKKRADELLTSMGCMM